MGRAKLHTEAPAPDNGAKILQFKIWLKGISPMIWRRVQTPASTTLRELHGIFQVAMGWEGVHLFLFNLRTANFGSWQLGGRWEHDKMWGGTGDLYGNTVAGIWRTPHFVMLPRAKAGGIELAIIDTAPHSNAEAATAASLADFVLIPCRPARFDLDAIASTVEIARAANAPCGVVINAARAALTSKGVNVIETVLHQRAAYSHAVIDGRSVHEYEPNGAAAEEIDNLYNHITRLYGDKKRKGSGV
jgi:chromosome partitioning protein